MQCATFVSRASGLQTDLFRQFVRQFVPQFGKILMCWGYCSRNFQALWPLPPCQLAEPSCGLSMVAAGQSDNFVDCRYCQLGRALQSGKGLANGAEAPFLASSDHLIIQGMLKHC